MLMMDSVTRFAMAQREVGLAIGEPPATRGYTPSVFALLPRLLERAGTSDRGSITGLYTVLVDGDDMNEPIADAVRSILDGHVVLTRSLAHAGHYPAIDVLQSVSRLIGEIVTPEVREAGERLRSALAAYREKEDLISIGAYQPGTDPILDAAIGLRPAIDAFLKPAGRRAERRRRGRRAAARPRRTSWCAGCPCRRGARRSAARRRPARCRGAGRRPAASPARRARRSRRLQLSRLSAAAGTRTSVHTRSGPERAGRVKGHERTLVPLPPRTRARPARAS